MTHAWDIAAYAYQAAEYCPDCIPGRLRWCRLATHLDTESILDEEAALRGVDRYDEPSYDSDKFPKVVFAAEVGPDDTCDECGEPLT